MVSRASVSRVLNLKPQTRCYVPLEDGGWIVGRVIEKVGAEYHVRFPNRSSTLLDETVFYVRWDRPLRDPIDALIAGGHETPHFAECRRPFVREITRQRAGSRGLSGVLSGVAELYPHQIDIAARVLLDPIPRYLLADEVGLGKTIEAGFVIRQFILDRPGASVVVIVPSLLVGQWKEELERRFVLTESDVGGDELSGSDDWLRRQVSGRGRCLVLSHEAWQHWPDASQVDLVVVDEAHRIAAESSNWDSTNGPYQRLAHLSRGVPGLLLLSATPLLYNEESFLRMLHLLDPEIHDPSDIEAFRARIQERRRLGLVFQAFRATTPEFLLEEHMGFLEDAFPGDAQLGALLGGVRSAFADQERLETAVGRARTHISETYRLHRRVLRTRRDSPRCASFPIRGRVTPTVIAEADPYRDDVSLSMDRWREQVAFDHGAELNSEYLPTLVARFLEATGSIPEVARAAAEERLRLSAASESATRELRVSDAETRLLGELVEIVDGLDPERRDRVDLIVEVLRAAPADQKLVVFSGHNLASRIVADACQEAFGSFVVARHMEDMETEVVDREVARFQLDDSCRFLICDESAEEGRNFQFAGAIVHVDLPWNPNRLEQRIGRLDRYGSQSPAFSIVFGPKSRDTYDHMWIECLRDGYGVFDSSIASLQYVVDATRRELIRSVVSDGSSAVDVFTQDLPQRLGEERTAISEIEAIETIEEESSFARGLYDTLTEIDEHWRDFQVATDDLLSDRPGNLRFHKTLKPGQPSIREYSMVPPGDTPNVGNMPLIPWDRLLGDFKGALTGWGTYSRALAVRNRGTRLYRLGEDLIEAVTRFTRWDDRGRSHVMWRSIPSWEGEPEVVFRFDYVVEADISPLAGLGDRRSLNVDALRRRLDRFLPPSVKTLWIHSDGTPVSDVDLLEILGGPYEPGTRDLNISPERRWPSRTQWERTGRRSVVR